MSIIGTLERGILILMIYLLPLIILFFINKFKNKDKFSTTQIKNFLIYTFVKKYKLMSHQKVFEQFKERAENASPLGGTLKFMVDQNAVFIDGNGDQNTVSMDDLESDCTITVSTEVLEKLRDGALNPMMAVMGGQIKIDGDMGLAMKVQSLM